MQKSDSPGAIRGPFQALDALTILQSVPLGARLAAVRGGRIYSTVTLLARFLGLSTS